MSISVVRVGVNGLGELFCSRTSRCTSGSWRGRPRLTSFLVTTGGEVVWNDANEKSRELLVKLPANLAPDYLDELYPWIADRLLGIRKIAGWLWQCDGRQSGVAQDAK